MGSSGSDSVAPVVGVSTYRSSARWGVWDREAALLPGVYLDAVVRAGGIPVLLPVQPTGADDLVARIDGLVLSGGPDVDPARYDAQPHERTVGVQPERDAWESSLLRAALDRQIPVLAICRGMQMLNVARGGSLHQHLPDTLANEDHCPAPARFGASPVRIAAGSRLAEVLGAETSVSCYHHQGLDRLGEGVRAVAWAGDDTVEAVELEGSPLVLGVQWHPEENLDDLRVFEALVESARDTATASSDLTLPRAASR